MELTIEKLIYGGDGLARLPAESATGGATAAKQIDPSPPQRGKAVFLPFVLEGERVEATLIEEKPGFARARVNQILEPSPRRIAPQCPYFARCGGCHYQHTTYEHQLEIKAAILKENLRRTAKLDLGVELQLHPSPPWNYRNRTRLRVQTAQEFALGYYKFGSHELLPVEQCPISSPLINRAIEAVWDLGRLQGIGNSVREIELFANAEDSELLVEVYVDPPHGQKQIPRFARNDKGQGKRAARLSGDRNDMRESQPESATRIAETLRSALAAVVGVTVFPIEPRATEIKTESDPVAVAGAGQLQYKTDAGAYRVSAGAFFQVNRFLTDELVAIVTEGWSEGTALDLYAGVGLFAAVLSREFQRVIAVESSQQSSADLAYNVPANVKAVHATVDQYLATSRLRPDFVVVDPPRSGLGTRVAKAVADLHAPAMTYVSCDPATLARDLVVLLAAGYRVQQAHLVDLFPQTFHLETVLHLTR